MHVCVLSSFSHVQLFVTLGTLARQAPLSMGFSRQEYWSGLSFPPPGDLPNPGIQPLSLNISCVGRRILTTRTTFLIAAIFFLRSSPSPTGSSPRQSPSPHRASPLDQKLLINLFSHPWTYLQPNDPLCLHWHSSYALPPSKQSLKLHLSESHLFMNSPAEVIVKFWVSILRNQSCMCRMLGLLSKGSQITANGKLSNRSEQMWYYCQNALAFRGLRT